MPTWLITGCSSGLGRSLAKAALEHGCDVAVTARDPKTIQDLADSHGEHALIHALDVTDPESVKRAVTETEERFGGIDVLVNNAGYGYRSAIEEAPYGDVETLFATNFFGAVALVQAVLPGMRARRSGTIVNVSSIGVQICPTGSGYYAASKAALEAVTASLRKEVESLGITAMIVEPGAFRTDFYDRSLKQSEHPIDDYAATVGIRRKGVAPPSAPPVGDPERAAKALIAAVEHPDPPLMLVLGPDALRNFRGALQARVEELNAWEDVSVTTSFPEGS